MLVLLEPWDVVGGRAAKPEGIRVMWLNSAAASKVFPSVVAAWLKYLNEYEREQRAQHGHEELSYGRVLREELKFYATDVATKAFDRLQLESMPWEGRFVREVLDPIMGALQEDAGLVQRLDALRAVLSMTAPGGGRQQQQQQPEAGDVDAIIKTLVINMQASVELDRNVLRAPPDPWMAMAIVRTMVGSQDESVSMIVAENAWRGSSVGRWWLAAAYVGTPALSKGAIDRAMSRAMAFQPEPSDNDLDRLLTALMRAIIRALDAEHARGIDMLRQHSKWLRHVASQLGGGSREAALVDSLWDVIVKASELAPASFVSFLTAPAVCAEIRAALRDTQGDYAQRLQAHKHAMERLEGLFRDRLYMAFEDDGAASGVVMLPEPADGGACGVCDPAFQRVVMATRRHDADDDGGHSDLDYVVHHASTCVHIVKSAALDADALVAFRAAMSGRFRAHKRTKRAGVDIHDTNGVLVVMSQPQPHLMLRTDVGASCRATLMPLAAFKGLFRDMGTRLTFDMQVAIAAHAARAVIVVVVCDSGAIVEAYVDSSVALPPAPLPEGVVARHLPRLDLALGMPSWAACACPAVAVARCDSPAARRETRALGKLVLFLPPLTVKDAAVGVNSEVAWDMRATPEDVDALVLLAWIVVKLLPVVDVDFVAVAGCSADVRALMESFRQAVAAPNHPALMAGDNDKVARLRKCALGIIKAVCIKH